MKNTLIDLDVKLAQGYQFFRVVYFERKYVALVIENEKGVHFFNCSEEQAKYRSELFQNETPFYIYSSNPRQFNRLDLLAYQWALNRAAKSTDWTEEEEDYLRFQTKKNTHPLTICLHLKKPLDDILLKLKSLKVKHQFKLNNLFPYLKIDA